MIEYNEFKTKFGEPFIPLDDIAVLDEIERLISDFNSLTPVIFRANHASNVYSLGGTIPQDKEKILSLVRGLKNHPEMLKPKVFTQILVAPLIFVVVSI
jgi:hypothetical protein